MDEPDEEILQELEMMKRMGLPTSFFRSPCDLDREEEVCTFHFYYGNLSCFLFGKTWAIFESVIHFKLWAILHTKLHLGQSQEVSGGIYNDISMILYWIALENFDYKP